MGLIACNLQFGVFREIQWHYEGRRSKARIITAKNICRPEPRSRYHGAQKMNLIGKIKIQNFRPGAQDGYILKSLKKRCSNLPGQARILNKDDSKDFNLVGPL